MCEITIIVPVYNVQKYLSKCVNSVLSQTFQQFEILLVNDGSTDKSGEICDYYSALDSRIHVFHKENAGLSSARNYGIQRAGGAYAIFLDSDDYWTDDTVLERMYHVAKQNDADVVRGEYTEVNEGGDPLWENCVLEKKFLQDKILDEAQMLDKIICGKWFVWLSLYRLDKLVLFDENRKFQEDIDFCIRMFSQPLKCIYLSMHFYAYVKHKATITASITTSKFLDSFSLCRIFHENAIKVSNKNTSNILDKYGIMHFYYTLYDFANSEYFKYKPKVLYEYGISQLLNEVRLWAHDIDMKLPLSLRIKPYWACVFIRVLNFAKQLYRRVGALAKRR